MLNQFNIIKVKTLLSLKVQGYSYSSKRSMFKAPSYLNNTRLFMRNLIGVPTRSASYHVDNATTLSSSHEQAQANPLLGKVHKVFQHPFIGRQICVTDLDCKNKLCDKPCGPIKENSYVGHGTHSDSEKLPGVVSLGITDFKGENRPQFAVMYSTPVPNNDVQGNNVNVSLTNNLNNNETIKQAIHRNCSKKSVDNLDDDIS